VDNLSRRGAEVNLAWLRARGVTDFVWADIRDAHEMHALLARNADAVQHLAAQVAVTTSVADFAVNVLGTLNVLEAVRTAASGRAAVLYSSWLAGMIPATHAEKPAPGSSAQHTGACRGKPG
jgi:CDP-paratose 2-epimerase